MSTIRFILLERGSKTWSNDLVGKFVGLVPNFGMVQRLARILWGKNGEVEVSLYCDWCGHNVCIAIGVDTMLLQFVNVKLKNGVCASVFVAVPWLPPKEYNLSWCAIYLYLRTLSHDIPINLNMTRKIVIIS
ncbi:hypothetical protein GQ457_11G024090 [Hibiscus cannabinus]